ncbi:hypothetical protein FKM82_017265 [Ascaphus truei]
MLGRTGRLLLQRLQIAQSPWCLRRRTAKPQLICFSPSRGTSPPLYHAHSKCLRHLKPKSNTWRPALEGWHRGPPLTWSILCAVRCIART